MKEVKTVVESEVVNQKKVFMQSIDELKDEFGTDISTGLTSEQVLKNQTKYGVNQLQAEKKQSLFVRFLLQFTDTLIIILLAAAIISLVFAQIFEKQISGNEWFESGVIFFVVILNAIIGIVQEAKAEKSLEALKSMSAPLARVLRDSQQSLVKSEEIVVGDILQLEAGDIIPADCRIIECANLKAEEAALTGESVPVDKSILLVKHENAPLGDRKNMLFSSTAITNGRATALVTSTGMNTEVGHIAQMLIATKEDLTPLQKKLNQIAKVISFMCLIICGVVLLLEIGTAWLANKTVTATDILEAFKSAIALAVAAIPEGLATVITIVLSIGVNKMAKEKAIVKKLPAVETLGSTSIVCSDKTGTLTQNKMTVVEIFHNATKKVEDIQENDIDLVNYFAICSDAKIVIDGDSKNEIGDPTEVALIALQNKYGTDISGYQRVAEIPFDSERKLMTVVVKKGKKLLSITKGAPDILINKAVFAISKDENIEKEKFTQPIHDANNELASRALRVLGLGIKEIQEIPTDLSSLEENITFVGLVGMIDPPRPEVKEAIATAKKAGIRSIMITGDHIATAKAIAMELGILNEGQKAITSQELQKLSDEYLYEHIEEYSVYARVAPSDKVRIVDTWQRKNRVVAMTGDGVNDSPALKKADIGCAMGITGTNVSKEASDMVLMDDNFATIILAVKEGRGIYDNLKKCVQYLLSSNIGEVLTIFIASLLGILILSFGGKDLGIPLMPIHLLWINLITDALPAFGLGMERPQDDVMNHAPRNPKEGFFANGLGKSIIIQGIFIGFITLAAYLIGEYVFNNQVIGQTMAFFTLSGTQLFHSFNIKSSKSIFNKSTFDNKFLIYSFLIGFVAQFAVIYIPYVNNLFGFAQLGVWPLLISIGLSVSVIGLSEIMKLISKKSNKA